MFLYLKIVLFGIIFGFGTYIKDFSLYLHKFFSVFFGNFIYIIRFYFCAHKMNERDETRTSFQNLPPTELEERREAEVAAAHKLQMHEVWAILHEQLKLETACKF